MNSAASPAGCSPPRPPLPPPYTSSARCVPPIRRRPASRLCRAGTAFARSAGNVTSTARSSRAALPASLACTTTATRPRLRPSSRGTSRTRPRGTATPSSTSRSTCARTRSSNSARAITAKPPGPKKRMLLVQINLPRRLLTRRAMNAPWVPTAAARLSSRWTGRKSRRRKE